MPNWLIAQEQELCYSKCKTGGKSHFLRFWTAKCDGSLVQTAVYIL